MIKKFCRWWLRWTDLWDAYNSGWMDGVDQQRFEPKTCEHHVSDFKAYFGVEEE